MRLLNGSRLEQTPLNRIPQFPIKIYKKSKNITQLKGNDNVEIEIDININIKMKATTFPSPYISVIENIT